MGVINVEILTAGGGDSPIGKFKVAPDSSLTLLKQTVHDKHFIMNLALTLLIYWNVIGQSDDFMPATPHKNKVCPTELTKKAMDCSSL